MNNSPIILALDSAEIPRCVDLINQTRDSVAIYKIGLEFFNKNGISGVQKLRNETGEFSLFLDLKLHDIPNTVAGACRSLKEIAPDFLTVHAGGGGAMIAAAVTELPKTCITAVTVLTSLDDQTLEKMGFKHGAELAVSLADHAVAAGARAIVTSPKEVALLRPRFPRSIKLITPGVRPKESTDDQARTATPISAISAGSDYLVIGRPITGATNPNQAAAEIFASLN